MKKLILVQIVVILTSLGFSSYGQSFQLKITGIQKYEGKVIVAIYNNEADWFEKPFKEITVETNENSKLVSFDVPYGNYAVSVYQDTKANGVLDRNFIGIPIEPIAFGNNYQPFGDPDYEKASIKFNSRYKFQTLKLYTVF